MKTYSSNSQMVNIREGVEAILATVLREEQKWEVPAICRHLKGEGQLQNGSLSERNYFGVLGHYHPLRIFNLLNYLLNQRFLASEVDVKSGLKIAPKGLDFLRTPSDLMVSTRELNLSAHDHNLRSSLYVLRQELSETTLLPPFRIFTDYTIQRIVQNRPRSLIELEQIPGMGAYKAERYGESILNRLKEAGNRSPFDPIFSLNGNTPPTASRNLMQ